MTAHENVIIRRNSTWPLTTSGIESVFCKKGITILSVEEIRRSAANGQLAVILGAGASMALTPKTKKALSWTGLVRSGLEYGKARGLISEAQFTRQLSALESDDIDDLLGAAEFVGRKFQAPDGSTYARWMRNVFQDWSPEPGAMQNALRAIDDQRILIATLNYDTLAEACTGSAPIDFADTEALMEWLRKEQEGILHLHGVWTNPKGCIFGIRDYHSALGDETRLFVQRSLTSLNRLLFIGCGDTFIDPNFSALISWLRSNMGANIPQHYALVRNDELKKRLADPDWRGFVEPLGYGDEHTDLPGFLLNCFPTRVSTLTSVSKAKAAAGRDSQVISAYRNFLLRDCGEMTIEGMRADMETAQRKFDLEQLFVPLEVEPFPPVIPLSDPNRDAKLKLWRDKNSSPIAFAEAFRSAKKIALLALPGGGKTLLLKRLAVAYSYPARRESSNDNLPELDLLPILIRCREWKEYIRQPITTMLKNMAAITGEPKLDGLLEAVEKRLKAGTILFLIDGLDEIHDDSDRTIFVENLEKFLTAYPKIRLLVTSREAGFELVAPCLIRFCTKFAIARLSEKAISDLCGHWHRLMGGGTPEALSDAAAVSETLLRSDSLRRLAENPLLLTMLLVVKHGAGRLPPDRVSLYERAVEVLLDTWNIKGHEALNVKEAVPQLACLAFELLRRGKQTATEREILEILEEAREKLPMVGRYAKDSPHDFLKRVELRSSLMLEGGHTTEGGKTVPFYQFRHLTFQEYLAAVAAVDGYTLSTDPAPPALGPLRDNLISDEWKEVIPMAAVLARMQAGPLLEALTTLAETEKKAVKPLTKDRRDSAVDRRRLPPATGRLTQSMAEEAVFPPNVLSRSVRLIAYFANGCSTNDNWQALSRGPYGPELRKAAVDAYLGSEFITRSLARNTVARLEALSEPSGFWVSEQSEEVILSRLGSRDEEPLVRAILGIAGAFWDFRGSAKVASSERVYQALEKEIFDPRPSVNFAAVWTWGFWRHLQEVDSGKPPRPNSDLILRLADLFWFDRDGIDDSVAFAISELNLRPDPLLILSSRQKRALAADIRTVLNSGDRLRSDFKLAVVRLAFVFKEQTGTTNLRLLLNSPNMTEFERHEVRDIRESLDRADKARRTKTTKTNRG